MRLYKKERQSISSYNILVRWKKVEVLSPIVQNPNKLKVKSMVCRCKVDEGLTSWNAQP